MVNVVNITFYNFLPLLPYTHSNLNIKDVQTPWLIDSISKCLGCCRRSSRTFPSPYPDKPPPTPLLLSRYISNISLVTHSRFTPDSLSLRICPGTFNEPPSMTSRAHVLEWHVQHVSVLSARKTKRGRLRRRKILKIFKRSGKVRSEYSRRTQR